MDEQTVTINGKKYSVAQILEKVEPMDWFMDQHFEPGQRFKTNRTPADIDRAWIVARVCGSYRLYLIDIQDVFDCAYPPDGGIRIPQIFEIESGLTPRQFFKGHCFVEKL